MTALVILLYYLGYCFAVYALIAWVPPLLYYSTRFLVLCVWEAAKLVARVTAWALLIGLPIMVTMARRTALFTSLFWQEWQRGDDDHPHDHRDHDDHHDYGGTDHQHHADDPVETARKLLGLGPDFDRDQLNHAYKSAIRKAHPDAGGTVEQAAQINSARDVLKQIKGWS